MNRFKKISRLDPNCRSGGLRQEWNDNLIYSNSDNSVISPNSTNSVKEEEIVTLKNLSILTYPRYRPLRVFAFAKWWQLIYSTSDSLVVYPNSTNSVKEGEIVTLKNWRIILEHTRDTEIEVFAFAKWCQLSILRVGLGFLCYLGEELTSPNQPT